MYGKEYANTGYGMKGQEHCGFDSAAGNLRGTMADTGDMENQQDDMQKAAVNPCPASGYVNSTSAKMPWSKFAR